MSIPEKIKENSDSLIELLGAQCSDLEKLLALAKEETGAAEQRNFTRIWDIVTERALIGRRLDAYHQQISELRARLESDGENPSKYDITGRVIELANLTLIQDQQTRKLLNESREESLSTIRGLSTSRTGMNAYLAEKTKGLAYSRNF